MAKNKGYDSVSMQKIRDRYREAPTVLLKAQQCHSAMDQYRKDRRRNYDFLNGKQWNDRIKINGKWITEEENLLRQGHKPLTNNLIFRLVRNVIGLWRSQGKEPTCVARDRDEQEQSETMSTVLQYNWQLNQMTNLNAHQLYELLTSGLCVTYKAPGEECGKYDCWTDEVDPNFFFLDGSAHDFRGFDVEIIGHLHDVSFGAVLSRFAKSEADRKMLEEEYSLAADPTFIGDYLQRYCENPKISVDFLFPEDHSKCRVIEVWTKESKERYRCHDTATADYYKVELDGLEEVKRENQMRVEMARESGLDEETIKAVLAGEEKDELLKPIYADWCIDSYWYYRYMTPTGKVLEEGETPYAHKSHPYCFCLYPWLNNELHSFVSLVIDTQIYTNRLLTLYDFVIRSSAKGVLLVPEDSIPDGMDIDDIAEQWTKFNGAILIKTKAGVPLPQQISSNSTNIGIADLLNYQLKFFEDISGVHASLQGKGGTSAMSGVLYAQQAQNASTSLLDVMDVFSGYIIQCAYKDLKNIQQFYEGIRPIKIAGHRSKSFEYDADEMRDLEMDVAISESTTTAAYRQYNNELLLELLRMQAINVKQLLEFGNLPNADALLQSIESEEQQMQQQQQMLAQQQGGIPVDQNGMTQANTASAQLPEDVAQPQFMPEPAQQPGQYER